MNTRQLFTRLFLLDAAERVAGTFAATMLAFIGVDATPAEVSWYGAFAVALLASLVTLLKAIVAAAKAGTDTASLTVASKKLES